MKPKHFKMKSFSPLKAFLFLSIVCIVVANNAFSQPIFFEDFNGGSLPTGWDIAETGGTNVQWEWSDTADVGFVSGNPPPLATFNHPGASLGNVRVDSDTYGTSGGGGIQENSDLISPKIDLSAHTFVQLKFWEHARRWTFADTCRVYISLDSTNWTEVYDATDGMAEGNVIEMTNPHLAEIDISAIAGGQSQVWIRWNWVGDWGYYWIIDDVELAPPPDYNLELVSVTAPKPNGCALSATENILIKFLNKGVMSVDSFMASYSINGGTAVSEQVVLGAPLATGSFDTYTFTTTADFSTAGAYTIDATVALPMDSVPDDDDASTATVSASPADVSTGWMEDFDTQPVAWVYEDVNTDGVTWLQDDGDPFSGTWNLQYMWNTDGVTGGDDWAFSPCLDLTANTHYILKFMHHVGEDSQPQPVIYPEKLSVSIGNAPLSTAMALIEDLGTLNNSLYEEYSGTFMSPGAGTYHLGFYCYSDPDMWFLNIDDVSLEVLTGPTADFSFTQSALNVTFINASSGNPETYLWDFGDGTTSNNASPGTHSYPGNGTYIVSLTVSNLASSDTHEDTVVIEGVGIDEYNNYLHAATSLYPNPTSGDITVMMTYAYDAEVEISVVNMIGEKVHSITTSDVMNKEYVFDMSQQANGVYFVEVKNDEAIATKRFVLSK